ncbi:MAG: VOC family protein [Eggerthella lenta]
MIDHVSIKVKDVEQAKAFYEAALAPLGYVKGIEYPGGMQLLVEGEPGDVWVAPLPEGAEAVPTHLALRAADAAAVAAFYEARWPPAARTTAPPARLPSGLLRRARVRSEGNNIEAVIHDWPSRRSHARGCAAAARRAGSAVRRRRWDRGRPQGRALVVGAFPAI